MEYLQSPLGHFVEVGGFQQGSGRGERTREIQERYPCVTPHRARSNLSESFHMDEHLHLITSTRFLVFV